MLHPEQKKYDVPWDLAEDPRDRLSPEALLSHPVEEGETKSLHGKLCAGPSTRGAQTVPRSSRDSGNSLFSRVAVLP